MEWKEVRLGDVCSKIGSGATPLGGKEAYKGGDYHLIRSQNVLDFAFSKDGLASINDEQANKLKNVEIIQGDVLLNITGDSVARCCIVPSEILPARVNQHVAIIRPRKEELDNHYLLYYLQHYKRQLLQIASAGATRNAITKAMIENLILSCPKSLDDQRRIASILSSLDRKIELNNKINADLEEMAQAIFKNWLSECSDEVTIGELSLNITNYEKTDAEEVVLINSSDVTEGYFDHHNYSPNKNLKGHFKKRFQKGDILYSQVRPRNRHWAYCNFDANDYLASTQLMVIRNNPSLITSILLYQYIISDNVWKEFTLKTETRSGTFPQGNYEDLSQIRVPYNSDVEGISNQLETLYAKMFMLEKENSRLSLLRDTLLPRLMSGELEVPE
ncbi:restriction endonuclease subunit S [Segatella sp.]|uniref:restriction endonuclease subunit S n=1 Tax=Segatella sp. TaxID=2974253 RepID=UPI003079D85D